MIELFKNDQGTKYLTESYDIQPPSRNEPHLVMFENDRGWMYHNGNPLRNTLKGYVCKKVLIIFNKLNS